MKTLICDCNGTMQLDAVALEQALQATPGAHPDGVQTVHRLLCRRQAGEFQRAAKSGEDLLVACTQEARLFLELNEQTEGAPSVQERPIRFVNIRETAGWSRPAQGQSAKSHAAALSPKVAALLAIAQRPEPDPVATVSYESQGRCLVIGPAVEAEQAARLLDDRLEVSVLMSAPAPARLTGRDVPQQRLRAVHAGQDITVSGWLGAFDVQWRSANPIDLDLCTRCNACVEVCPEGAISLSYQIDLSKCRSHRDCVKVCDAAGAIDFQREPQGLTERFDLVLDLREQAAFTRHQPPQGYFHVPPAQDSALLTAAVLKLRELTGTFDKPKFFTYRQKLCAHSRNERIGCTACIDVCSAQAIRSDASLKGKTGQRRVARRPEDAPQVGGQGGGIVVEPHLCVGCGACSTVCPSGALSFNTPKPSEQGARMRTALQAWRAAGGMDKAGAPLLLLHSQEQGQGLIDELGRLARVDPAVQGLPARVLPLPLWHVASTGLELWLSALCFGAGGVAVMLSGEEAPDYRLALKEQAEIGDALLVGLGLGAGRVQVMDAADARALGASLQVWANRADRSAALPAATFAVLDDKRATLELAIDHLCTHAAHRPDEVALPTSKRFAGSPFGTLVVDAQKCTLCLSCVGACPENALADNPDKPQLRFIEKNCVQCGLCAGTCPENAITLEPRLLLADEGRARKQARVLHEVEPFRCVRCSKPFGTLRAIENMIAKLGAHPAFQGAGADRLKMCGDCRVIDLHSNPNEMRITDL